MADKYAETSKRTVEGDHVVYHKLNGGRGRPARYVKQGTKYVALGKGKVYDVTAPTQTTPTQTSPATETEPVTA